MGGKPNRILTILAIVLAVAGAAYLWTINLAILRDRNQRKIDELQLELMATRDALRQSGGDFGFLSDAMLSMMKPNDRLADARRSAGMVLHRDGALFVAARNLPPTTRGKAYALWAYFEGKPEPAGQFHCGTDGMLRGRHTLGRDLGRVEGFSLTLENAGSAASPAGPVFLTRP